MIAIARIVRIVGVVNSDVHLIVVIADRFFSDRSDHNDQMDTRLYNELHWTKTAKMLDTKIAFKII